MRHRIPQNTIVYAAFVVPYSNEFGPEYSPFGAGWAHHFLAIFSKVNEFVQNSVFSLDQHVLSFSLKSGAPSAKMTKRADLGLKTLFCTNWCAMLKIAKKGWTQCENDKTCWSRDQNSDLVKLVHLAENAIKWCAQYEYDKTCWSRAENSVLYKFVQNSVSSSRSARFVIFALGTPLIDGFQQSARVCAKQHFQPEISTFCHFRSGRTTF